MLLERLLAAAATLSATGSASPRPDRTSWLGGPRFYPTYHPYAREGQAVVGPLLRGRWPSGAVAPTPRRGQGRGSLRHFRLARGGEGCAASSFWFIRSRAATRLEAIGPSGLARRRVVMIYWFRGPRVNPSY